MTHVVDGCYRPQCLCRIATSHPSTDVAMATNFTPCIHLQTQDQVHMPLMW